MKLKLTKAAFSCLMAVAAFAMTSCDDSDSPKGGGATVKFPSFAEEWSSQAYTRMKMAQVITNVANPQISTDAPQGYRFYLMSTQEVDEEGLNIYWVMADMPEITQTTTSNEYEHLTVKVRVTGSKNTQGQLVDVDSTFPLYLTRFYCPVVDASQLAKDWYLTNRLRTVFDAFGEMVGSTQSTGLLHKESFYDLENTPLVFSSTLNGSNATITYNNTSSELVGWISNAYGQQAADYLNKGLWNTGAYPSPAVYYITPNELKCMAVEYDSNGEVKTVYRYTLQAN